MKALVDNKIVEVAELPHEVYAADEIAQAKAELAATDYKCMKHADGELTDEEYEPIRQYRRELRARINELEALLG